MNIIDKWLFKEYKTPEFIMIIASVIGIVSFSSRYLGNSIHYVVGTMFLLLGLYGIIRKKFLTRRTK